MNRIQDRRHARPLAAVAAGLMLASSMALPVAAHDPDPVLSGSFFAQDQALLFDWRTGSEPPASLKSAIKAAAGDATSSRASRAATFAFDSAGKNPIGYGAGNTCGPNGIACFTRDVPDGFTMWFREQGHKFDWGSLKWCQSYADPPTGCFDAETIALDEFGHVEGLDHHVNYGDDHDYLDAVVQTVSRAKPADGLEHAPIRPVRHRDAPARVRRGVGIRVVLDLPRSHHGPHDLGQSDIDRLRGVDDPDGHAQGGRHGVV